MKHNLLMASLLVGLLTPAFASANPEPTAYDARSIAMGLTGTTYLDGPAALVLNPANLEGIEKLGFSLTFTALMVNQRAPVQGPNTVVDSGLGFGPIPAGFIAGRIAPRVVFAGGIYIETGYGSDFADVVCMDGAPVGDPPDYAPNNNTDPEAGPVCTNPDPQNLDVTFFVGEFAAGFSFRAHEKFILGLALRLPFAKQTADLWQNIGAALGTSFYGRVKNDLGGVGFPSIRFGFTIKPHRKVRISAMYRMFSKIKMTGSTDTALLPGADPLTLQAQADWVIPNALQMGISYQANPRLLLVFEARLQFHGADKTGNQDQTVTATDPAGNLPTTTIVVPFGWQNVWSLKLGFEYRFTKDVLALRLGANAARGATTPAFAQYFTPPPAPANLASVMAGLGFYWDDRNDPSIKDKYRLDIGGLFAFTKDTIGNEYIGQDQLIPGTDPNDPDNFVEVCSDEQVVRTGCPGEYRVFSYWASVTFTLQY
jgi:hypothetical protein